MTKYMCHQTKYIYYSSKFNSGKKKTILLNNGLETTSTMTSPAWNSGVNAISFLKSSGPHN